MVSVDYIEGQEVYVVRIGEGEFDSNDIATITFINDGPIKTLFVSKRECDREFVVSDDGSTLIEYYNAVIFVDDIARAECIDFDTLQTYYDVNNINLDKQNNQSLGYLHIVSLFTCAVLLGGYLMKSIRKITR